MRGLGGKLTPAGVKRVEDLAVAAVAHVVGHPPHIDCRGQAKDPNVDGGSVRGAHVVAPVPAVAKDGESTDIDGDAFRHVDIDVPARRQDGHRRPLVVDARVPQVEVEICADAGDPGPPAQPEPPAPGDMAEQGGREVDRLAARARRGRKHLGQVVLEARQFPGDPGPQRGVDALGELFERQAAREQVLPQGGATARSRSASETRMDASSWRHCGTQAGRWLRSQQDLDGPALVHGPAGALFPQRAMSRRTTPNAVAGARPLAPKVAAT